MKTRLSKKQLAIVALVVGLLLITNISLALYFMTKQVQIFGGVIATVGTIEVYQSDGVTPLTSHNFTEFPGGFPYNEVYDFFINNTGALPVYVYWNMSTSSINWTWDGLEYVHNEGVPVKYKFGIFQNWTGPPDYWEANTEAIVLGADEGVQLRMRLNYSGTPNTSETFTLTESFHAYDS